MRCVGIAGSGDLPQLQMLAVLAVLASPVFVALSIMSERY